MPITAKLADKSKPILSLRKNLNLEPSGIKKIDIPLGTEQSNIIACFVKGDKKLTTKQVLDGQYTEKTYYLKKKVYNWGGGILLFRQN